MAASRNAFLAFNVIALIIVSLYQGRWNFERPVFFPDLFVKYYSTFYSFYARHCAFRSGSVAVMTLRVWTSWYSGFDTSAVIAGVDATILTLCFAVSLTLRGALKLKLRSVTHNTTDCQDERFPLVCVEIVTVACFC